VNQILYSEILSISERSTLLTETLKLAFSKPGFQSLLEGLEIDDIKNLDEILEVSDFEAKVMLNMAGLDLDIGEPEGPIESLYHAIDNDTNEGLDVSKLGL
jgi:hypothetical protein